MRRPLIAGNWKMYKTVPGGVALAQEIRAGLTLPLKDRDVLVAPPFTAGGKPGGYVVTATVAGSVRAAFALVNKQR